jgi:UDP-N-acetyl-D-mannosaminuronate dehydrogenase
LSETNVVVVGMGEVGHPLFQILSRTYPCKPVDIAPFDLRGRCSVLHICYPFQIPDFFGTTSGYVGKYQPELTIIHSTVPPGTTRKVQALVQSPLVYSPVRGKHSKMESDMLHYRKFVGGFTPEAVLKAERHFSAAGFSTATFPSPEIGEISKLLETTWLGVLIGWAQEAERIAARHGATYEDINAFIKEIDFLPSHVFPGYIGGHCVMSNIEMLQSQHHSPFLKAVVESNQIKREELKVLAVREKTYCSKSA